MQQRVLAGVRSGAWPQLRTLAADYALLAVLDARSAALRLAWLLSAGLVLAVLVVTAWLAAVTALLVGLVGDAMSWPAALALASLANIGGAIAIGLWMRGLFEELPFAATLRQLKGDLPAEREDR